MRVTVTEMIVTPPETIFAVLTDIPHHTDWVDGLIELISLKDDPAKLGTMWE
jgi:hypothetical protein